MVTRLAEQTDGAGTSDSDTVILQQTERGSVSKRVLSTLWGEQRQDDAAACMQVQPKHDVYVENYSRILVPKQSVDQQQAVPMLKPTLFRWSEFLSKGWQVAFPTMRVGEKAVITCDGAYVRSLGHLIRLPSGIDSIEHTVKILGIASVPDESEADQEARFEHYKVLANELYRGCDFANALSMYQMLEHAASGRSSDAFRSLLGSASANASMCYVKLSRYQDALRAFEQILALEDISDVLKQKTLLRKAQTLATTGAEREAVALLKRLRIDCSESDSPQIQALLPDVQRQLANTNQAFRGLAGKLAPVASSSSSSSSPPPSAEGSTPAQQVPTQEEAAEEQEQEMDPETQELINKARQAAATLDIHQIRRDMLSIFSPHTLTPLLSLIRWFGHYAGLRPILNAQRALGRPLINEVVWLLIRNSFITLYDCTPSASNPAGRPVRQLQMPEGVFLFNVLGAHIKVTMVPDAEAKQMPGEVIDQLVPITLDDTQLQQLQKKVHIRYLHRYLLSHFTSVEAVPLTKTINAATNSFGYAQNRLWTSKTPIGERNSIVTAYINLLAKKRAIELQPPVGPRKARVWIKDYYQTWSRIDDETDSTTDDNYASDDSD